MVRLASVTAALLGAVSLSAQQAPAPLDLARLSAPVVLDGNVTDAEWRSIRTLPMTMYSPVFRGDQTERTEIRVAYDSDHLYASGRFYDTDPEGIRVNSLYRDRWAGDDVFAIFIDSFNDNQSSRWFTVNPAGVRMDRLLGADGSETNSSWDTYWDVETSVDEEGWYFEMRIPFSSLRFQTIDGNATMGITVTRLIARKNERVTFPAIEQRFSFRQPSVAQDFVLSGINASKPAYLTAYALGGGNRSYIADPLNDFESDRITEAGLDLKYSLTDNFFLDASINTDFAQVEADEQQINLTRFPLFFPEKRQFFQERSDLFQFDLRGGGRLFHSRRIGLSTTRDPVRILGGARVAGRVGDWDIGALNMQSDEYLGEPGENFGVFRVKRRYLNDFSYLGGVFTSRVATDGERNLAFGLDTDVRMFGDHYSSLRVATTSDSDRPAENLLHASNIHFEWARRASRGLTYWFRANRVGRDYQPDLGFLPRFDYTYGSLYGVYNFEGHEGDLLRSWGPGLIVIEHFRNEGFENESSYIGHWWNYELWNGSGGWLQVTNKYEDVQQQFELGDGVIVPEGGHGFTDVWFRYGSGPASLLRMDFSIRVGGFYDGRQVEMMLSPTWNLSRHLELSGDYRLTSIDFDDRNQSLDVHLARLRIRAAANAKLSAAVLAQYNSVSDRVGANVRIRYNMREGTDLWIVYDEVMNSDRDRFAALPRLPLSQTRALRVKFSYSTSL